jgi:hypothetical protein
MKNRRICKVLGEFRQEVIPRSVAVPFQPETQSRSSIYGFVETERFFRPELVFAPGIVFASADDMKATSRMGPTPKTARPIIPQP